MNATPRMVRVTLEVADKEVGGEVRTAPGRWIRVGDRLSPVEIAVLQSVQYAIDKLGIGDAPNPCPHHD